MFTAMINGAFAVPLFTFNCARNTFSYLCSDDGFLQAPVTPIPAAPSAEDLSIEVQAAAGFEPQILLQDVTTVTPVPVIYASSDTNESVDVASSGTAQPKRYLNLTNLGSIGEGSFGNVYKVRSNFDQGTYALKFVRCGNDKAWAAAIRELEIWRKLSNCAFVPRLLDSCYASNGVCFLTDVYDKGDLVTLCEQVGQLPVDTIRFFASQLVLAILDIHRSGVSHLDVKLDNILVSSTGYIALCDFGMSATTTEFTAPCGTDGYQAPEILEGSFGREVDWWALGVVLYIMAVGDFPWEGNDIKLPLRFPAQMDRKLRSLIKGLLQYDRKNRLGDQDILQHGFFIGFDWPGLISKTTAAPWTTTRAKKRKALEGMPDDDLNKLKRRCCRPVRRKSQPIRANKRKMVDQVVFDNSSKADMPAFKWRKINKRMPRMLWQLALRLYRAKLKSRPSNKQVLSLITVLCGSASLPRTIPSGYRLV